MRGLIASTLIVAAAVVASEALVPIPFKTCGSAPIVTVTTAEATSWPPASGASEQLVLQGNVGKEVSGGNYAAVVEFDGIPLISKSGTLADLAKKLNVTLPWPAGPLNFNDTITVPTIPLHGAVTVSVSANNTAGDNILCFSISANI